MADMLSTDPHPLFCRESIHVCTIKKNVSEKIVSISYQIAAECTFPFPAFCFNKIRFSFFKNNVVLPDLAFMFLAGSKDFWYDILEADGVHSFFPILTYTVLLKCLHRTNRLQL